MNVVCEVCGDIGFEHLLLCCSDCKGGHTHQYCLAKILFHVTLEDWFCDECSQRHSEGSHSRSLEKVSSERPSNHARFDYISQELTATRLESARVVGSWGQQKSKSTVVGASLKKKHSSRVKYLRKKCIRNKSNMRGKGINRRVIRSKRSSNFTEQLNLSIGQVGSALSSKVVEQPTSVIVNALGYTLGETSQPLVLKPLEGLACKSMQTSQSLTTDQAYSTSALEISLKAKFALEASATEVDISDTVQNMRKDSPKKRRRLILTGDDEDEVEEEKAEVVLQENVNHQPLIKCNEPMVKHRMNTEYYVEDPVQFGDINAQNLIIGGPKKRRRRYIVENEDEEVIEGAETALNNASKWYSNDSANMASETPVATDHSLQSRSSDSECADQQYLIWSQPFDDPVWSGVFKIGNEVCLKLDAHLSNKACQRVHELSGLLQPVIEVRMLSRLQAWPERWISSGPTDESIGQNEDLTRLNRIIKSDDALQITVGSADLLIFSSVLLPEQYHFFQGKHYLWGVFRQRKDILDNGFHVEDQDGSVHATGEGQHQEHSVLDQHDEALFELSDKETFAAKHVVDAEDQLQMEGDPEVQNDTMKVAACEGISPLSSRLSPAEPDSSKAGHFCSFVMYCLKKVLYNTPKEGWCFDECNHALSNEKPELEAELKSARSELEKCQIEVKFLRERNQTLEEKEVAWLGSEECHEAAITAFKVEQDKLIQDKSAHDSEIKTFHVDLEKAKIQVESYKSQLKAAKREKKAAAQKLKTSKQKAKCHLIDSLTSYSGYLLALVQSAHPDFDPSSIDWAFRCPDPDTEALIERNMGMVWRFVQKFVTDVGVGQQSLSRKRPRKLNTRISGQEWRK